MLASVVALSTATFLVQVVTPTAAHATVTPNAKTAALEGALGSYADFVDGLHGVGAFDQPLAGLDLRPGSAQGIGLSNALSDALQAGSLGSDYDGAATVDDLAAALDGVDSDFTTGDRHVAISATKVSDSEIAVDATITRDDVDAGLRISSKDSSDPASQRFDFNSTGGIPINLSLETSFHVVTDSTGDNAWIIAAGASAPSLTLSATADTGASWDPSTVRASIGILGVELGTASTFAADYNLTSSFSDPDNNGQLSAWTSGSSTPELQQAGASAGLGTVTFATTPGSLAGSFDITARSSSAISGIPGANATVSVADADVNTGTMTASYTPGALDNVEVFENMTPSDLATGLAQLASTLASVQSDTRNDAPLPFMQGTVSQSMQAGEAITAFLSDTSIIHQANSNCTGSSSACATSGGQLGSPTFASIQDLFDDLEAAGTSGGATIPDGTSFTISDATYDTDSHKLSYTLGIARSVSTPVELDQVGTALSSDGTGVTYEADSLTDSAQTWATDAWKGRIVTAGTSRGLVLSNTSDTLTLDSSPFPSGTLDLWSGGTPTADSPYAISGADAKTGLVTFANDLQDNTGITNANANAPVATVVPDYSVTLPVVLDLQDPVTGSDCAQFGTADCPFTQDSPDGSSIVVESLPTQPMRTMIDTTGSPTILTGDAPISSDVDVTVPDGYVSVHVTGTVTECTTNDETDCSGSTSSGDSLQSVSLAEATGADGSHDLTTMELLNKLLCSQYVSADPADVPTACDSSNLPDSPVSGAVHGQGYADLTLTVAQPSGSTEHLFDASDSVGLTLTQSDITDPSTISVSDDVPALQALAFDSDHPQSLFGGAVGSLHALANQVQSLDSNDSKATTQLPVLGKSFQEMLGESDSGGGGAVDYGVTTIDGKDYGQLTDDSRTFDNGFVGREVIAGTAHGLVASVSDHTLTLTSDWNSGSDTSDTSQIAPAGGTAYTISDPLTTVVAELEAAPTSVSDLQSLLDAVTSRLGHGSTAGFTIDTSGSTPQLDLHLDWQRRYRIGTPIAFDFTLNSAARHLTGNTTTGVAKFAVDGQVDVTLVLPLTTDAMGTPTSSVKVDPGSTLRVQASTKNANGDEMDDGGLLPSNVKGLAIDLGDPSADAGSSGVQIHGDVAADLSDSTDSNAVALDTFGKHLTAALNSDTDAVTCDADTANRETTDLSLCAVLPAYKTDNGTDWTLLKGSSSTGNGDFLLRLPKTLSALANPLSGNVSGTTPRFVAPDGLSASLADLGLDFSSLGSGLDAYLGLGQQALLGATADGKIPLVGQDLQEGTNFVGNLQATLDGVLAADQLDNGGKLTSIADIKTLFDTTLPDALSGAGLLPNNPSSDDYAYTLKCSDLTLAAAAKPTNVVATDADPKGTTSYTYKIVAVRSGDGTGDAVPSPASSAVTNDATGSLDANNHNAVSWNAVDHADHYKVLGSTDGTTYKLLATVSGTSYDDQGAGWPGSTYTAATAAPNLKSCPDSAAPDDVTGVTLVANVGQGTPDNTDGCTGSDCLGLSVPFSPGLPGLAFKPSGDDADNLTGNLGWSWHLDVSLDKTNGFEVNTNADDELKVGLALDLPSTVNAKLSFLNVTLAKHDDSDPSSFAGKFAIDFNQPGCSSSCKLTAADLADTERFGDFYGATLDGAEAIDWDVNTGQDPAFPGLSSEFHLEWSSQSNPDDPSTDAPVDVGDVKPTTLAFDGISIDTGELIGSIVKPITDQLEKILRPLQPVVDALNTPIPVLSDFSHMVGGGDITILDLARIFNTLASGPAVAYIGKAKQLIETVKALDDLLGGSLLSSSVSFGSFEIDAETSYDEESTPDTAHNEVGTKSEQPEHTPKEQMDSQAADAAGEAPAKFSAEFSGAGISFPVLTDTTQVMNLLVGGDASLVEFDSGTLTLGFTYEQEFGPVWDAPPIMLVLEGSASVSLHVVAGFDTYGIRQAIESGRDSDILDSLYLKTTDDDGEPIPVVSFEGELGAGASVSLGFVDVGLTGGVFITIDFTWNDPDNDGKFRFTEFLSTAVNNPLCLFNMDGSFGLYLRLHIKIGFGIFSTSYDITLAKVTIVSFSVHPNCTPPPPKLGQVSGSTLYVFAGRLGTTSLRGDSAWGNGYGGTGGSLDGADEKFTIYETHDSNGAYTGYRINAIGFSQTFADTGVTLDDKGVVTGGSKTIDNVVLDARGYTGNETVLMLGDQKGTVFDSHAFIYGGDGDDQIVTGQGKSTVDGGAGKDRITTKDRPDLSADVSSDSRAVVAGGAGDDSISVGNGNDNVAGDGSLSAPTASVSLSGSARTTIDPAGSFTLSHAEADGDGSDSISLGLGSDNAYGGGGDDSISVGSDSPLARLSANRGDSHYVAGADTIVGGTGDNHLQGGSNDDTIWAGQQWPHDSSSWTPGTDGPISDYAGVSGDGTNTVNTAAGNDTVYGGSGVDNVSGGSLTSQSDTIYGAGDDDVVMGGYGTDHVYGGPGDDYVIAEPSTVSAASGTDAFGPSRTVAHTPTPNTPSAKTLVGGAGKDHIYGGDGGATIYGDSASEAACPTPPTVRTPQSDPPSESGQSSDGNDLIIGGAGVDVVQAGGGNDSVTSAGDSDYVCGGAGNDTLDTGSSADTAYAGSGNDVVLGQVGDDHLYGNAGNDSIYGAAGDDTIEGNGGADYVDGADGNDVLYGGTTESGDADSADVIQGGTGTDTIVGDNGKKTGATVTVYDLGSTTGTLGGGDTIAGGDDNDNVYGGLGNDSIGGGTGDDYIEGNPGADAITGDTGDDDITGGSSQSASAGVGYPDGGDNITGGDGQDVVIGDNGHIERGQTPTPLTSGRTTTQRKVTVLDQGSSPTAGTSGGDTISGGNAVDVLLGEGGSDTITGDAADDYIEGGQGADTLSGNDGDDDIVGGSSATSTGSIGNGNGSTAVSGQPDGGETSVSGGTGQDVILGDNGVILRGSANTHPSALIPGRESTSREIDVYDIGSTDGSIAGGDTISGDDDSDIVLGQAGDDVIHGNAADDYLEGGGGSDTITGDAGDDDILGGSSTTSTGGLGNASGATSVTGQPDAGEASVSGGAGQDVVIGDNGVILRGSANTHPSALTAGRTTTSREIDLYDIGSTSSSTSGGDAITGDGDVDVLLGQGGGDAIHGNDADDYVEGGSGNDTLFGDAGDDDIVGGSSAPVSGQAGNQTAVGQSDGDDTADGGDGQDVVIGDNGVLLRGAGITASPLVANRVTTAREIDLYDLAGSITAGTSGADAITGDAATDVLLGQAGDDRVQGGDADDYVEGGPGADWIEGDAGDDDLVGGSSTIKIGTSAGTAVGQPDTGDVVFGGGGDDAVTGDNAVLTRPSGAGDDVFKRLNGDGTAPMTQRNLRLLDLAAGGSSSNSGDDWVNAGSGADVVYGQDGNDAITGGAGDDYVEGNGGADTVRGDADLSAATGETSAVPTPINNNWRGTAGPASDLVGDSGAADGQDDLIGGSSTADFRDDGDAIEGDGGADFLLGDDGTLGRTITAGKYVIDGPRYQSGNAPADAVILRHSVGSNSGKGLEFCSAVNNRSTCAVATAAGDDTLYGSDGEDTVYGEDGKDTISGGAGDDDLYGGLGADTIAGDGGADAMIGDRGGIRDLYQNGSKSLSSSVSAPPAISGSWLGSGTVQHQVDLLHVVDGANVTAFVGSGKSNVTPYNGVANGGNDTMSGGTGDDAIHGAAGNDIINGEGGDDVAFGDDGADVMWGGTGNDGLFGGKGATDSASVSGDLGADIIDMIPRGTYADCTPNAWPTKTGTTLHDPCAWWVATDVDGSGVPQQHHQGVDWIYGGWDRDVMQADVSDNGPNPGDRLIDWSGAYNLYTHCNSAYGGFNDVREFSPSMQSFLFAWSWGVGAGQTVSDVTTSGTSAFDELALVYTSDIRAHATGSPYPGTPGNFDTTAC